MKETFDEKGDFVLTPSEVDQLLERFDETPPPLQRQIVATFVTENLIANAKLSEMEIALRESVSLQSHYAALLNDYDGGKRLQFESSDAWVKRLKDRGKLK
jgi:hypothetical protein